MRGATRVPVAGAVALVGGFLASEAWYFFF